MRKSKHTVITIDWMCHITSLPRRQQAVIIKNLKLDVPNDVPKTRCGQFKIVLCAVWKCHLVQ